jgi:hypothetical protein
LAAALLALAAALVSEREGCVAGDRLAAALGMVALVVVLVVVVVVWGRA